MIPIEKKEMQNYCFYIKYINLIETEEMNLLIQ